MKALFTSYIESLTVPFDSQHPAPTGRDQNCSKSTPSRISIQSVEGMMASSGLKDGTSSSAYIDSPSCLLPQYHIYTWVLAMMTLASFLKLNYIIKSGFLVVMVSVYTTLMLAAFPQIFTEIQVLFFYHHIFYYESECGTHLNSTI